jgi:hypothetical protein
LFLGGGFAHRFLDSFKRLLDPVDCAHQFHDADDERNAHGNHKHSSDDAKRKDHAISSSEDELG